MNEEELHGTIGQFDKERLQEEQIRRLKVEIHKLQEDKDDLLCFVGYIRKWVTGTEQEAAQHVFDDLLRKMRERHSKD